MTLKALDELKVALDLVGSMVGDGCGSYHCLFVTPERSASHAECRCVGRGGGFRKPGLARALAVLYKAAKLVDN